MYYEIYVDSLLLVNLVMNLYCLELVNLFFLRSATRRRIVFAATLGAVLYLIPFLLPGSAWYKIMVFFPVSALAMIRTAFRIRGFGAFLHIGEVLLVVSFAFGGGLLFVIRSFSSSRDLSPRMIVILGIGALLFIELSHLMQRKTDNEKCTVELVGMGARVKVTGLVDSGNGLVEPISGQPVCILDKSVFDNLWRTGKPAGFRVIPYHSVGIKNGILYGYLIPEMLIERNGIIRSRKNIYIGVCEGTVAKDGGYCMIVPPEIL